MRTIHLAAFAVGLLALLVANATAETSPILNIVEVQKLVASGTPDANARLAAHFTALSDESAQAAATLGELAAHHRKLAAGVPFLVPPKAAAYQSGKGAREPTENDLRDLAAKAITPADHRALMEYFNETAKRHTRRANEHQHMAVSYRGTRIPSAAVHCDHMVTVSRDAAKQATAAATMHKDLSAIAR